MALPAGGDVGVDAEDGVDAKAGDPERVPRGRRASAGATGGLPLELTSFVGRRHELTETKNLLAGSRLVTLGGSPQSVDILNTGS